MTIRRIRKYLKSAETDDELYTARRLAKKIRHLRLTKPQE